MSEPAHSHRAKAHAALAVIPAALAVTLPGGGVIDAARRMDCLPRRPCGHHLWRGAGKLARRGPAVFIPWADVERIVLYPAAGQGPRGHARVTWSPQPCTMRTTR
jgi:hypothetical protein